MNQRLKEFINWLIMSGKISNQTEFCQQIGMKSTGQLSGLLMGHRVISPKFAKQLAKVYPELNPAYLLDEGCTEMLRPVDDHSTTRDFSRNVFSSIKTAGDKDLVAVIQKQQEQIDRLLAIIEKLTK